MTQVLGDYELLTRLASGGMAEVYVARSTSTGDICIVKQMLQKFVNKPEFVEMFLDEGRVVSSLHHPNIVSLRDFGFHDELPYLAMEYLHGVDLRTLMRTLALRRRMMPLEAVIYIITAICAGLHHSHEAHTIDGKPMEIIHRDVSPQNVVVTFEGGVKLIDFGIAKARGRSHETRSGALKGKVPYMSPEQVRSQKIDRRSDVYAVGVMLYELVVGRRPYVGNKATGLDDFGLMLAIVNHDIVPASAVRPGLHPKLDAIIIKALEANVTYRYQTAQQLGEALTAVATELGMLATPKQLAALMVETLGERISWAEEARTNEQIIQAVSTLEHCKTVVGENHDPLTVDPSEVAPSARLKTSEVRGTDTVEDTTNPSTAAVDKVVDANVTRLRFRRLIEPTFRWSRLFDGIEGVVEIDFSSTTGLSRASIGAAAEALRSLGSEVSEIRLIAAPVGLEAQVADKCRVLTVAAHGKCPTCATTRAVVMPPDELRARIAPDGTIPCPECGTSMVVDNAPAPITAPARPATARPSSALPAAQRSSGVVARPVLATPSEGVTRPTATITAAAVLPPVEPLTAVTDPNPPPPDPRRGLYTGIGLGVGLAMLVAGGVALWLSRSGSPEPGPIRPAATSGHSWQEGNSLVAEGRAIAASKEVAASGARTMAIRILIGEIENQLPPRIKALQSSRTSQVEIIANVEVQLGSRIQFEPRLVTSQTQAGGIEAVARYALTRADLERAVSFYSAERAAWGLQLVNAPPTRPPGVLVLSGQGSGPVVAGDRIVAADRIPLGSLDAVTPELRVKPQLELIIEHQEQRTIKVRNGPE